MIENVAEKFKVSKNLSLLPVEEQSKLTKLPYRELLGSLMYMLDSTPDVWWEVFIVNSKIRPVMHILMIYYGC